ncbi:regulator of G-protein signaling loco isoform X2 [Episyrphus balteatus]|uniref:regulator of G-protein signaling loco isoform X2 n=1 Tax=Episyrphus balteatus TaxID=286459 RepID=UPI0024869C3A|nr:regulator of G-protein signaling loco isoform X2 [Episyrphus balteatus]
MHHHHHQHRRRKKRPNYGTRTVEVSRGFNGFGFTISGQQPCILSCIVANSPADQAGLRAGDFLISVNNLNVSKLPHETVVQLIGNSFGSIKMQIAENYFSDSSDEENAIQHMNRGKPSYLHHKLKMNRLRTSPQKHREGAGTSGGCREQALRPVIEDIPLPASLSSSASHNIIHSPNASTSKDISNVSAMVRVNLEQENLNGVTLEYRAIVGYLGTIEMPKQIAISSKLQTVRSCIRKLRQEKRNPTTVLMTILPNCLTLQSSNATILATYPSSRLNYVSSSSESENRFFGLVTSAIYSSNCDDDEQEPNGAQKDVSISNSCHVFVVDTKICEHNVHEQRAAEFRITCTKDPISNLCLEFPNNSEYVVNLIRSMYTMRILPPAARNPGRNAEANRQPQDVQAHSPQPSNHSEVTTTSSNSDSGIGFHNDCTNISDRILVVDFPGIHVMPNRVGNVGACARPAAIFNNIEQSNPQVDTRLTVRAMPDPKAAATPPLPKTAPPQCYNGPNLLASLDLIKSPISSLVATRSCDDVLSLMDRQPNRRSLQMSMDDISIHSSSHHHGYDNVSGRSPIKDHVFIPPLPTGPKQSKKSKQTPYEDGCCFLKDSRSFHINKLSPKVYGMMETKGNSASVENLASDGCARKSLGFSKNERNVDGNQNADDFETWGSLQNIHKTENYHRSSPKKTTILEATYSEPDLGSRALPSDASPFRRWAQSSFRAPRTVDSQVSLARRPSSLTASDNDVYTKSMETYIGDFKAAAAAARNQLADVKNIVNGSVIGSISSSSNRSAPQQQESQPAGVTAWGNSFEKLLEDPAGLHTFAEFLKKEFSAENIYFWTACERYRFIESASERATMAMEIYSKHLANGATEPVNVDSQARTTTQENLRTAEKDLFGQAQKQIFNLMKFDSYQRFIRSDMYKKCIEAEEKHQPLPYSAEGLDELLKTNFHLSAHSKLKKSASNAEDRRRKSLLPWHRKTRCKSRDRDELDNDHGNSKSSNNRTGKYQQSTGNSLKITNTTNSTSDIHSSRSSLSSFDTLPQCTLTNNTSDDIKACCLCRVILCDGATTIVQTKPDETVRQLVERLLEKRGISYQLFEVILNSTNKTVDLNASSQILSGKELLIEQKVAFKLDLPDPKVISVKSKPKKALCDVIKPILQKYNYCMENVQILMRDTHEPIDLSQPVTIADGQRLQVVMLKADQPTTDYLPPNSAKLKPMPKNVSFPAIKPHRNGGPVPSVVISTQQSTLDEITNKVFSELLQGKVESHDGNQKAADIGSMKSDDCASETSSIFDRIRRRDSNIPGLKGLRPKKINKISISQSDDALTTSTQLYSTNSDPAVTTTKKPVIAKWKAGVKVQVTERAENQEGLKRAQCARLEDQRGTEINFELPDFLKNKENQSAANKLRKIRANLSPVNKSAPVVLVDNQQQQVDRPLPQPAPRLSITKKQSISPMKIDEEDAAAPSISVVGQTIDEDSLSTKGPPPLPPKPKVLPIKPSNWGQSSTITNGCSKQVGSSSSPTTGLAIPLPSKIPVDISRKHLGSEQTGRTAYLDEPSSSFV